MFENEEYLGDGLYVSFDGFTFWLRAPREGGDHYVALVPEVLTAFGDYVLAHTEAKPKDN
jgi:hypothetical protein